MPISRASTANSGSMPRRLFAHGHQPSPGDAVEFLQPRLYIHRHQLGHSDDHLAEALLDHHGIKVRGGHAQRPGQRPRRAGRRRASARSSTGVLPLRALYARPRTEAAGLTGTTWRVTSQSNRYRMAASCCLTLGAAAPRSRSPHAATVRPLASASRAPRTTQGIRLRRGYRPGACVACGSRLRRIPESAGRPGRRRAVMSVGNCTDAAARTTCVKAAPSTEIGRRLPRMSRSTASHNC